MRKKTRFTARQHYIRLVLSTTLGSKTAIITTGFIGSLLISGAAYAALYGGGPAESWTIAMITALTTAVVAKLAAFQSLFMLQSQLRFEQLISAMAVATKQEATSANQVVDATRNAASTMVNAVRAQRINDSTVKAYLDYSPATGQGYDVCATILHNRSLDKAFDDAPAIARKVLSELDVAPGKLVDSQVAAMSDRLELHRSKFCTPSEASAGLCSIGSVPGGDSNASLLFSGAAANSDVALARKSFIQNVIGAPDEKISKPAGNSPAGQNYLFEKNRKDSLLSIPAYSLAMIDANNTRSDEFEGMSPNEMMKLRVNQYFGGKEAKKWSSAMAGQTTRGLIVEATKMAGLEVWMRHKQYEQGQRLEANMAALVLSATEDMKYEVARKHASVLKQNATGSIKP